MKLCKQKMFQLQPGNEHSKLDSFSQSHQQTEHTQDTAILNQSAIVTQSGLPQSDHLDDDVTELFQKCSKSKHIPILFCIECSPYCELFTQSSAHLPVQYHSLFDSEQLKLNYLDLVEDGQKMKGLLEVTEQQCRHLEELTRGQAFSKLWIHYHCGRITASRLYKVVRTDLHKPVLSLITSLCYPETEKILVAAIENGKKHEKLAISAYKLAVMKKHKNLKTTSTGILLYRHRACFDTSPDSM